MAEVNVITAALRKGDIDTVFTLADKLYEDIKKLPKPLVKDRTYHFKTYKMCFKGDAFVTYLGEQKFCETRAEAQAIGCTLLMLGFFRHVVGDHHFKDEPFYYRFARDEPPPHYQGGRRNYREVAQLALRIYAMLSLTGGMIATRGYGMRTYHKTLVASSFVAWLVMQKFASNIAEAVSMGALLRLHGFIHHAHDDHDFRNDFLFFRFYWDELLWDPEFYSFSHSELGIAFLGFMGEKKNIVTNRRPLPTLPDAAPVDAKTAKKQEEDGDELENIEDGMFEYADSSSLSSASASTVGIVHASDGDDASFGFDDPSDMPVATPFAITLPTLGTQSMAALQRERVPLSASSRPPAPPPRPSLGAADAAVLRLSAAAPVDPWVREAWYHGALSRKQTSALLAGRPDGTWIVRTSSDKGGLVLSVVYDKLDFHFIIRRINWAASDKGSKPSRSTFCIEPGPHFPTIDALLAYYRKVANDIPCVLQAFVPHTA